MPQALAQGRSVRTMALYGQVATQRPALDAQALVDVAAAVDKADRLFRADFLAGVRQTALAHLGYTDNPFHGHLLQANLITLMSGGS